MPASGAFFLSKVLCPSYLLSLLPLLTLCLLTWTLFARQLIGMPPQQLTATRPTSSVEIRFIGVQIGDFRSVENSLVLSLRRQTFIRLLIRNPALIPSDLEATNKTLLSSSCPDLSSFGYNLKKEMGKDPSDC